MKEELKISIVQADLIWEDTEANIRKFGERLENASDIGDVIVFPEMFTTAFSTESIHVADSNGTTTFGAARAWAAKYSALVIGSFIAEENGNYFNRGFMARPDGRIDVYDKRHLFIGGEKNLFLPGDKHLMINYEGWNIALCICYDLRFPVWLRYNSSYNYDLLVCIAEWPENRQDNFETLIKARAIENQAYVCACNRIGSDRNFLNYIGGSQIVDFKGKVLCRCRDNSDEILTFGIKKYPLESNREKFPVSLDADKFILKDGL